MKILLYAYVNMNLGDDIFLDIILRRYPDVDFYLYVPKRYTLYYKSFGRNLKVVEYKEKSKIFQKFDGKLLNGYFTKKFYYANMHKLHENYIGEMDAQIWLGGSQFVETDDWKEIIEYKKYQQNAKIPFYSISATVGPYKSEEYIRNVKRIISNYDDFCCRDTESFNMLFDVNSSIRWAPDMVFSYDLKGKNKKKQLCISLINVKKRFGKLYGLLYINKIISFIELFVKKNYKVVLLSLCNDQKDYKCCEDVKKSFLWCESVTIIKYTNLIEILNIFEESEYVIGTRYHSIVLGMLSEAKILPISYETKTTNLMHDCENRVYSLKDFFDLPVNMELFYKIDKVKLREMKNESEKQFYALDKFIGKID